MTANIEKNYQERILKVLIHIQNHLDDPLSLEALAAVAHFSPYHFHRIFTSYTGESVKSYLRRLRLERATRDLLFSKKSLAFVSERAGYDTQQSFHRAFKEVFGITPLELREKKQGILFQEKEKSRNLEVAPTVIVKKIEPITVAFKRNVGHPDKLFETWLSLATEVGIARFTSEQTQKIAIPYDFAEITPTDKVRFDICVSLNELLNFKPSGDTGIQTIRGGKYAIVTHQGPLEKIESVYETLFCEWLPKSGYDLDDFPSFILHRTLPMLTQESDLISDIFLPIK